MTVQATQLHFVADHGVCRACGCTTTLLSSTLWKAASDYTQSSCLTPGLPGTESEYTPASSATAPAICRQPAIFALCAESEPIVSVFCSRALLTLTKASKPEVQGS